MLPKEKTKNNLYLNSFRYKIEESFVIKSEKRDYNFK